MSKARIAGFVVSNFLGLAIVLGALQFYLDARSIWADSDSFLRTDYMVINKRITSQNTLGGTSRFTADEIQSLESQPWVSRVAPFSTADYHVYASLSQQGRGMSTNMFFESIPSDFVDVAASQWQWREGSDEVPLIISKDYLTLYNFGFAASAGLPQMSEGLMSGIPLTLTLSSNDGERRLSFHGRVAGYSNRLNTILVPQSFMDYTNRVLGSGVSYGPSRLIVEVSKPGDVAIKEYLESHDYEVAGDKTATTASFLLRLIVAIVMVIGVVITVLSFFILLLSISLLMEKNREKIHSLLMLGYDAGKIGAPYRKVVFRSSVAALVLALVAVLGMRLAYLHALKGLDIEPGSVVPAIVSGIVLTLLIIIFNLSSIRKRIKSSWRKE
ncbi:MAG: ABC transporter permease [Bacteroides sp.]|nr:ABC transporter permease [Bacteroides sp.]